MAQTSVSDVVKNAVKAVTMPLEDGLCSVNGIYMKLIEAHVDPLTGQCSNYDDIRNQIVLAKQKLEQSEQASGTELKSLDTSVENLEKDEGKLEREKSAIQCSLDNMRTEQKSYIYSLKQSKDARDQAKINLDSTRDALRNQEERKRNAEIVTGVGGGLFIIPVIGWIAGSVMVATGAVELDQAKQAVTSAEEEVREFESQVENYRGKVSEYESHITQTKQNITQKKDQADKIHQEIQKVKEKRKAVAELQIKVRKIVHILSILSGRASVIEGQTRKFILQEPVMKVMGDLLNAAEEIFKNQLLSDEGIPKLIYKMKEHNQKLAAICASSNSEEVY